MYCPKCNNNLFEHSIVKYKDNGGVKIVGYKLFCPNRNCDYQEEVKNYTRC